MHAVASPVRLLRLGAAPRVPSLVWAAPPPGSPSSRVRRAAARARGRGDRDVAAAIACKRVPRGAALDGPPRHGPVSGVDGHLQRGLRRAHGLGRARHGAALLLPGAALSLLKSLGVCSPLCFTKRGAGVSYFSPLETTRPILLGGGYWRLCDLMDGERRSRPRPYLCTHLRGHLACSLETHRSLSSLRSRALQQRAAIDEF